VFALIPFAHEAATGLGQDLFSSYHTRRIAIRAPGSDHLSKISQCARPIDRSLFRCVTHPLLERRGELHPPQAVKMEVLAQPKVISANRLFTSDLRNQRVKPIAARTLRLPGTVFG
jgi:hypothetical protein